MNDRSAACEILRASVAERLYISQRQWESALREFEIVPVKRSGRLVGAVMMKGPEIHCGGIEKGWACSRAMIRKTLGRILDEYGYALTAVMMDNHEGQRFCERLGFEAVGYDGQCIHYRMRRDG